MLPNLSNLGGTCSCGRYGLDWHWILFGLDCHWTLVGFRLDWTGLDQSNQPSYTSTPYYVEANGVTRHRSSSVYCCGLVCANICSFCTTLNARASPKILHDETFRQRSVMPGTWQFYPWLLNFSSDRYESGYAMAEPNGYLTNWPIPLYGY